MLWGSSLIAFGAAVSITVILCLILQLQAGTRLASATVAIVIPVAHEGSPPWVPAVHRFLEVSMGIIVALAIAEFLWPSRAVQKLQRGLAGAYLQMNSLFQAIVLRYRGDLTTPIEQLRANLSALMRQNEDLESQGKYELVLRFGELKPLFAIMEHADRFFRALEALDIAAEEGSQDKFYKLLDPELDELSVGVGVCLKRLPEGLSTGRFSSPVHDFDRAIAALNAKAAAVRRTHASEKFDLQEILRLHTFILGIEHLARELA